MANRQHGRGRSPAAGRNTAGSRTARAVPVSRSPTGGRGLAGNRGSGEIWTAPTPGTPGYLEPEVRRWPHPVTDDPAAPAPEPALHYIRCALSYQNQLLADIKTLLEQMAAGTPSAPAEDPGTENAGLTKP